MKHIGLNPRIIQKIEDLKNDDPIVHLFLKDILQKEINKGAQRNYKKVYRKSIENILMVRGD